MKSRVRCMKRKGEFLLNTCKSVIKILSYITVRTTESEIGLSPSSKFFCYFRLLQSHRSNVSKELNRLRFHWGTRTAREEEDMDNIGAVERDGDEGEVVVDWDSLPDDLGWRRFNRTKQFASSFGLKNGLRFHFDSETCLSKLSIFIFLV